MRPTDWQNGTGNTGTTDELFSSMKQNFGEIAAGIVDLIESELLLAKTELQAEMSKLTRALPTIVVGSLFGAFALGLALLAAVYGLSNVVPAWLAALIVSAGAALAGGIFFRVGWKKIASLDFKPKQTIESVKENVVWLKSRMN